MSCPKGEIINSFRPQRKGQRLCAELTERYPRGNKGSKIHFGFFFFVKVALGTVKLGQLEAGE